MLNYTRFTFHLLTIQQFITIQPAPKMENSFTYILQVHILQTISCKLAHLFAKQIHFDTCVNNIKSITYFFHLETSTMSPIFNFILGSSVHGGQHPTRSPFVIGQIEPLYGSFILYTTLRSFFSFFCFFCSTCKCITYGIHRCTLPQRERKERMKDTTMSKKRKEGR